MDVACASLQNATGSDGLDVCVTGAASGGYIGGGQFGGGGSVFGGDVGEVVGIGADGDGKIAFWLEFGGLIALDFGCGAVDGGSLVVPICLHWSSGGSEREMMNLRFAFMEFNFLYLLDLKETFQQTFVI